MKRALILCSLSQFKCHSGGKLLYSLLLVVFEYRTKFSRINYIQLIASSSVVRTFRVKLAFWDASACSRREELKSYKSDLTAAMCVPMPWKLLLDFQRYYHRVKLTLFVNEKTRNAPNI